jgi:hypothetical protein
MVLRRCCLGITFDNLLDTIGTYPIMMENKMNRENPNYKPYPQAPNIRQKP